MPTKVKWGAVLETYQCILSSPTNAAGLTDVTFGPMAMKQIQRENKQIEDFVARLMNELDSKTDS